MHFLSIALNKPFPNKTIITIVSYFSTKKKKKKKKKKNMSWVLIGSASQTKIHVVILNRCTSQVSNYLALCKLAAMLVHKVTHEMIKM